MAIESWRVDPTRSEITFTLRHLVLATITGRARGWKAALGIDEEQPSRSSLEVTIDAGSIDTGDAERDDHLRSAEFLNAAAHPEIRFASTTITPDGEGRLLARGPLTIRSVSREVPLEILDLGRSTDPNGDRRARFRGHATFDRQAFGLHWNQDLDRGGVVLGDRVEVNVVMEAVPTNERLRSA